MSSAFYYISFILLPAVLSARFGHEVGSTSMDSTHYDRRSFYHQCPLNSETKESSRARVWLAIRSSPLTINNSNQSNSIPFRRQLVQNNGEDRLVTRAPANTTSLNSTTPLGIDQATVDIVVDKQVENDTWEENEFEV